jgi:hypothetical protein
MPITHTPNPMVVLSRYENKNDPDDGDLMTIEEFRNCVATGMLIDYDGDGSFANFDGHWNCPTVLPSTFPALTIPSEVTHVFWYNR